MSNLKKGKEVRDRERAKNKGRGTGGGKKFSIENEDELAIRNRVHGDDDDDDEEEEEKPKDNVFGFAKVGKAVAAAAEESDEDESGGPVNPNRGVAVGPSRKEREAADAIKAKEDYMRRHLAGETEQAKKDMERLVLIRARREAQAKQREAEGRLPGWSAEGIDSDVDLDEVVRKPQKPAAAPAAAAPAAAPLSEAAAKKKAAAAAPADEPEVAADGGPPKLKAMEIKQMNGDALKDALKARGLQIQGAKKDLIKRLSDYEAARP